MNGLFKGYVYWILWVLDFKLQQWDFLYHFLANTLFKNEKNIYCLTFVGDVAVSENLPNEEIDTGHSCRTTAQAQNVIARLKISNYTSIIYN